MEIKTLYEIGHLDEMLKVAEKDYNYQKELTPKLKAYAGDFTLAHLHLITLWKLNRYPAIPLELVARLNALRNDYGQELAKKCLEELLSCKGVDLAMASTYLRWLLPENFQIMDQRAYRILGCGEWPNPRKMEDKVRIYFKYLEELRSRCSIYGIEFERSDELLYQLDKIVNKDVPLNGYGGRKRSV